jgi:hypothetical protein
MTEYERSGQPWRDDPAATLVNELYHDISEELGTDGPAATFGHGDSHRLGRLVEEQDGGPDASDVLAQDSFDTDDLAAEELAMHYLEEDEELSDMSDAVRDELA